MLAVHTVSPNTTSPRPAIILIHGAANSARVWSYWQSMLADRGYASHAIDLRGHGASPTVDLSLTSMRDYADDVATFIRDLPECVLIGWSMGGLVAMIAAEHASNVRACVGLAPSTPAESIAASVTLRTGEFDANEYGITTRDPGAQPAMPDLDRGERIIALSSLCRESRYARDERAAGVVIESLPCPLLIATGTADLQWPRRRYDRLHLPADHVNVDGASHWGLVLNQRALMTLVPTVTHWIEALQR
jgi:pimeloyl-ACP methyl ester carboxylesterase